MITLRSVVDLILFLRNLPPSLATEIKCGFRITEKLEERITARNAPDNPIYAFRVLCTKWIGGVVDHEENSHGT